ncbi:MAG: aspartate kinase [Salibacteraceae bacterium]
MLVQKFGGTSVGNAERIAHVAKLIDDDKRKIVVLSAVAGTTDQLAGMAKALYKGDKSAVETILEQMALHYGTLCNALFTNSDYRSKALELLDYHWNHIRAFTLDVFTLFEERTILAQGELISTQLMHLYLSQQGVESVLLPALDFMRIDQNNEPDMWYVQSNLQRLLEAHPSNKLFITQGYICRNHFGEIDNLKRGGSDYTASIIGAALKADEVQIWTDIDGMHNNDPRVVKNTRPIERLTFDEAAELAYFGAKILHPSSVLPTRKANIPVVLKNTLDPEKPGTIISNEPSGTGIKAVAAKEGITAIKIKSDRMLLAYGFLRRVFEVFERHRIAIDMITTSEVAISLTIDHQGDLTKLLDELRQFGQVEVDTDQCIVCIVGHLLQEEPGKAAVIFDALRDIPLRMISYGGSRNNVSLLINAKDKKPALEALNSGVFNLS